MAFGISFEVIKWGVDEFRDRPSLQCRMGCKYVNGLITIYARADNRGKGPITITDLLIVYDGAWTSTGMPLYTTVLNEPFGFYLREEQSLTYNLTPLLFSPKGEPVLFFTFIDNRGRRHQIPQPTEKPDLWDVFKLRDKFKPAPRPDLTPCGNLLQIAIEGLRQPFGLRNIFKR